MDSGRRPDPDPKDREKERKLNEKILKRFMDEHGESFDRLAKM